MLGTDSNPCHIVAETLAGKRRTDERTFDALAALDERLERLKKLDSTFHAVAFSPDIEKLRKRRKAVAVG